MMEEIWEYCLVSFEQHSSLYSQISAQSSLTQTATFFKAHIHLPCDSPALVWLSPYLHYSTRWATLGKDMARSEIG